MTSPTSTSTHATQRTDWPYPFWIAHRGAGTLAPENTMAAFHLGAAHGYRMYECDANVSADGTVFLLHDERLERTSDGVGLAHRLAWSALKRLDAGAWHSASYRGEPLATLQQLSAHCREHGHCLNVEIKPAQGEEERTGRLVALATRHYWKGAVIPPLLSSFSAVALQAALEHAPELPRGLLLERWDAYSLKLALKLQCRAVVLEHSGWNQLNREACRAAGLAALAYTVNDAAEVARLQALGLDGLITDRVDSFGP